MKRIFTFAAFLIACMSATFAQYMPSEKGSVFTYESKNFEQDKTETYTATVDDVTTDASGVVTVSVIERHTVEGSFLGEVEQNSTYTYNPETGLTENVVMTAEEFKRQSMISIREMFAQMGQYPTDDDMAQVDKMFKPKGNITIPLPAKVTEGESFANSAIRANMMGQSMGMKLGKGSYVGYEDVEVSAGTYNCLKLTYTITFIGEQVPDMKVTAWYAPGVGLVKQLAADKKGKEISVDVLKSISKE